MQSVLTSHEWGPQEWHCTLRGPAGTDFEGGLYHFRIRLPAEYPFRPPSIMLLTPNGRFELNTKVRAHSLLCRRRVANTEACSLLGYCD